MSYRYFKELLCACSKKHSAEYQIPFKAGTHEAHAKEAFVRKTLKRFMKQCKCKTWIKQEVR